MYFHTDSLGIKISRHTDGYVRVLSVSPYRPFGSSPSSSSSGGGGGGGLVREGEIRPGDVVREVGGVSLRVPIDSAVWKLTVGLVRMAPRPLKFVVASELRGGGATEDGDDDDDDDDEEDDEGGGSSSSSAHADGARRRRHHHGEITNRMGNTTTTTSTTTTPQQQQQQQEQHRSFFVPPDGARVITFHQSCLGVKLRHDPADGRVRVLGVTPYRSFPDSPPARTGDIRPGDVILDVNGGCGGDAIGWDLSGGGDRSTIAPGRI